jgi:transcriptional regulator with XRE-family HTH domain
MRLGDPWLAGCYRRAVKPVGDIRRENLAALVEREGSQAAFARRIGKDKNQVNQWLGRKGARNISSETARDIEDKLGLGRGWLDTEHGAMRVAESRIEYGASQPPTLDPGKLQASSEFVDRLLDTLELEASEEARYHLIAATYSWLIAESVPNRIDMSRRLMDLVKERSDVRQREARSAR